MHPANAYAPIATFPVNVTDSIAVPANALAPTIVTDDGITIVTNDEQPANAFASIVCTVSGKITVLNEVHPEKVFAGI